MIELKQTHNTRIQPQHGRQHARERQLQQIERQRQQFDDVGGVPRSASSKHGRRWPARPRVGALTASTSFVTARPRRSLLGVARRSSVPSRGVVVEPQLTGVAGDDVSVQLDLVHRSTAHSTHARGSARTSFSSSTSERLNCSSTTVDLTYVRSSTVNCARNSRARRELSLIQAHAHDSRENTAHRTKPVETVAPRTVYRWNC